MLGVAHSSQSCSQNHLSRRDKFSKLSSRHTLKVGGGEGDKNLHVVECCNFAGKKIVDSRATRVNYKSSKRADNLRWQRAVARASKRPEHEGEGRKEARSPFTFFIATTRSTGFQPVSRAFLLLFLRWKNRFCSRSFGVNLRLNEKGKQIKRAFLAIIRSRWENYGVFFLSSSPQSTK
jgi:hypothetical protein